MLLEAPNLVSASSPCAARVKNQLGVPCDCQIPNRPPPAEARRCGRSVSTESRPMLLPVAGADNGPFDPPSATGSAFRTANVSRSRKLARSWERKPNARGSPIQSTSAGPSESLPSR